jgi:8-oxo-dGTP diphosphatase
MAHIHELIDLVVTGVIVHNNRVVLVHHKKLNTWLPIGGHVELDEDTDQAILREIKEESGLEKEDLEFVSIRPDVSGARFLLTPQFVDIHDINEGHRHLALTYFIKSKTDVITLAEKEHNTIKWFNLEEIEHSDINDNVRFLCREALKILGSD